MCLLIAEAITQYVGKAGCREGEINQKRLCYYPFLGERINFLPENIGSMSLMLLQTYSLTVTPVTLTQLSGYSDTHVISQMAFLIVNNVRIH